MPTLAGFAESFAPGTLEYKRVSFDVSKNKYYKPNRLGTILLTGFGQIPGEQMTPDQKKVTVSLESKVVDQMEFEILTHDARLTQQTTFVTGTLTTGTRGTASTYTVADASILRPFDIIQNMTTGEQLLVTAIDTSTTPDQITAYPAYSQTGFSGLSQFPWTLSNASAQTKTNGDVVRIVGTAFIEGSNASSIIDSRPETAVNYIQIFREDYGTTWEEAQTKKNGLMELADKEERALGNLLVKMEKALIEGKINKQSITVGSDTGTSRTMQGIKGTISTFNQAASALIGGGNDASVPKLDQIIDQIAPGNMSGRIIGFCSGAFVRKFRELMDNKVEVQVPVGSDEFGLKALVYQGQIPMFLVRHEIFDAAGNSDEAMFFDPAHYQVVNLTNGQLGKVSEKKGLPGANLANNQTMKLQDAHYGAYSMEYRFESAAALVTGLVHTISS